MNPKLESSETKQLMEAILALKDEDECCRFFEDICTVHEIQSLAQRWAVAVKLRKGVTYHKIAEETGASTATISRVNRCLSYGADGYTLVLDRLGVTKTENGKENAND